jgi:hypothetical protein
MGFKYSNNKCLECAGKDRQNRTARAPGCSNWVLGLIRGLARSATFSPPYCESLINRRFESLILIVPGFEQYTRFIRHNMDICIYKVRCLQIQGIQGSLVVERFRSSRYDHPLWILLLLDPFRSLLTLLHVHDFEVGTALDLKFIALEILITSCEASRM